MTAADRLAWWVIVSLMVAVAYGCAGIQNGVGDLVEMPPELMQMLTDSVGSADGLGGFRSPTDEPGMESVHAGAILATTMAVRFEPTIQVYADSTLGATTLLYVANAAGCPVAKGCLAAGGWVLIQTGATAEGYRTFGARHRDGRELGLPIEPPA